jgi:hypothetical protein
VIEKMRANQAAMTPDEDAQISVSGAVIGGLIVFAIALYVAAAVLPGAVANIETANTTDWSTGAVALWAIVGLVVVAGFIMLILRVVGIL